MFEADRLQAKAGCLQSVGVLFVGALTEIALHGRVPLKGFGIDTRPVLTRIIWLFLRIWGGPFLWASLQ